MALFNETREKFDEGLIDIPIAQKFYRMRQYQRHLEKNARNTVMSLNIMKRQLRIWVDSLRIAKRSQVNDGKPIETVNSNVSTESYLEARERVLDEY